METAYRAQDVTEAHIVCGMLQANGVDARVSGHYLQGGVGELATMGFANVEVPAEQLVRARALVAEYETGGTDRGPAPPPRPARRWPLALAAGLAAIAVYLLARPG